MNRQTDDTEQLAKWLLDAGHVVAFTGAGISTESGIPDFRSPGGIWSKVQPVDFQAFLASSAARHEYWRQKGALFDEFEQARPNVGHEILAAWESAGNLQAIITQNIDGLHQTAGSQRVLELHGTAREIVCLSCDTRFEPEPLMREFLASDIVPDCPHCGGWLKSATVSFGQSLPERVLLDSIDLSRGSDLFLAIGSSLVVEPAASLPRIARKAGAKLVIINREETDQDATAQLILRGSIGAALSAVESARQELARD